MSAPLATPVREDLILSFDYDAITPGPSYSSCLRSRSRDGVRQYSVYLCAIHKPAGPSEPRRNKFPLGQKAVDFFERWFGFSGGRGDGSLEFIFLLALFTILFVIAPRFLATLRTKWTNDKNRN
jgi:hypothetical protein